MFTLNDLRASQRVATCLWSVDILSQKSPDSGYARAALQPESVALATLATQASAGSTSSVESNPLGPQRSDSTVVNEVQSYEFLVSKSADFVRRTMATAWRSLGAPAISSARTMPFNTNVIFLLEWRDDLEWLCPHVADHLQALVTSDVARACQAPGGVCELLS